MIALHNRYDRAIYPREFVTFTNSGSMSSRWISHLIYKVCRTAFLIVTFLFSRILCFILPSSFISLRQTGIEASRPFSSLSTASFRHPLVPFLRARLKTRRPSIDGGVFDDSFVESTTCEPLTSSRDSVRFSSLNCRIYRVA